MKDKFIQAYLMRVDRETGLPYKGYLCTVENTLSAEQEYVNFDEEGGWIQAVPLGSDIVIICHDEGKVLGFPTNRAWLNNEGRVLDLFAGNIMAVRHTGDEFVSIMESDIPYIEEHLRPAVLLNGGAIVYLPDERIPEYKGGRK